MEFKKLILVLTIALVLIVGGMWGSTYAYYVSTGGPQVEVTTGDIDTRLAVIFSQNQYINMKTGIPILAANVDTQASKSIFTLVPNSTLLSSSDVAVNISLTDLSIDDALKVTDFKYRLVCSDGTTSSTLVNGTGTDFTNEVINSGSLSLGGLSTTNSTFNVNKQYTCTLSVWLQETGNEQNNLMNKKFSGLIKVDTMFKGVINSLDLINFTIDNVSYQAENGMTWLDWINSSYNTDGFYNSRGIAMAETGAWIEEDGLQMSVNEEIIDEKNYITGC